MKAAVIPAALAAAVVAWAAPASAQPAITGIARVIDAEILQVGETTVRLLGVDAPRDGQGHSFQADMALWRLAEGRMVVCDPVYADGRGRVVATCSVDRRDLGIEMIGAGLAMHRRQDTCGATRADPRWCAIYSYLEEVAQGDDRGLWAE